MKLYLFRHGTAMEREIAIRKNLADGLRPLTNKGREKTAEMSKHLKTQMEGVQLLIWSPLVRAEQTAQIIGEILPYEKSLECSELVPEAPPQVFANWLTSHAGHVNSVLAVGHEPQLSVFATWLLSGSTDTFFDLKKSAVIALEVESFENLVPGSAALLYMLGPRQL